LRKRQSNAWLWILAVVFAIGLLAVLTWANYRYSKTTPGGTDFLVHWVGTRSFMQDGLSPYSDEVALRIQQMVYGRPAAPGEHELRVAYPLYSMLVFLPFSLISNFELARAFWMTTLEVALILLTVLSLRLTRWKLKPPMLALVLLFSIFWYHAMRPLILGNAVILVALGITGAFLAIRSGMDELAGILLGLTTIKPQLVEKVHTGYA
jgi:hypothetical protein